MAAYVTRLAPSPTGALHLGNARSFLVAWLRARTRGGKVIMRIEDLAHPKHKPETVAEIYADLRWLGLDWDEGDDLTPPGGNAPYTQTRRLPLYHAALEKLLAAGRIYPCDCSRADIAAAGAAPHAGEELRYPNTCRGRVWEKPFPELADDARLAWRFIAPSGRKVFTDNFRGTESADLQEFSGDFVVARGFANPAYQLACVVDDAAMGVTEVIRGDDLVLSTFRQIALYEALELPVPEFLHLPLLVGEDGRRLAKRHGDTRLSQLRARKIPAGRLRGWLARVSGWIDHDAELTMEEMLRLYALEKIPENPVVVTARDREYLGFV